jgi:hypothetical protein
MKTLEQIFDSLKWERKFQHTLPDKNIAVVFRNGSRWTEYYFKTHKEETNKYCRAVFLGTDSLGQLLAVTEEKWEEVK